VQQFLAGLDFTQVANSVLALIASGILYLAVRLGLKARRAEQEPVATATMEGIAVVSSEPLKALAGSIEALGAEMIERRAVEEKMRSLIHQQIEGDRHLVEQMRELRAAIGRLGDIMIQRQ
jgi:hypothetical protein